MLDKANRLSVSQRYRNIKNESKQRESEVDLEGACGACAPLKFAKHMLYNVN